MNPSGSFGERIKALSEEKKTNMVLALDPSSEKKDILDYVIKQIKNLSGYCCAIKINFHVILPLSRAELQKITKTAHDYKLQVIADLKLNDIYDTNKVVIQQLFSMGFDCLIINPFIGKNSLRTITQYAHSLNFGIITLVYMSHPDALEGYGALVQSGHASQKKDLPLPLYRTFYDNSLLAGVDGIVIGGNRTEVIAEFCSGQTSVLPIYSPGLITQGGDVNKALESGSSFLIIGRAILESDSPVNTLKTIHEMISNKSHRVS